MRVGSKGRYAVIALVDEAISDVIPGKVKGVFANGSAGEVERGLSASWELAYEPDP